MFSMYDYSRELVWIVNLEVFKMEGVCFDDARDSLDFCFREPMNLVPNFSILLSLLIF